MGESVSMNTPSEYRSGEEWRPIPDPSRLTTDAVEAVAAQFRRDMGSMRELIETRLSGMDRAQELLADNVLKFPSELDKAIKSLRDIMDGEIKNVSDVSYQKFLAVEGTFASNALALTAALAAQKEAAAEQNKSNTVAIDRANSATKETIAANAAQTLTSLNSQAASISDLKERFSALELRLSTRLERGEGGTAATREAKVDTRAVMALGISAALMFIAVIGLVVTLALKK